MSEVTVEQLIEALEAEPDDDRFIADRPLTLAALQAGAEEVKMWRQGGLAVAWYEQDDDDSDQPDGLLLKFNPVSGVFAAVPRSE